MNGTTQSVVDAFAELRAARDAAEIYLGQVRQQVRAAAAIGEHLSAHETPAWEKASAAMVALRDLRDKYGT